MRTFKRQEEARLLAEIAATDYKALKFAEGELSAEEYEPTRQQRIRLRQEINRIRDMKTGGSI
jgi:uncharacterized Rmd1/YagE family protein